MPAWTTKRYVKQRPKASKKILQGRYLAYWVQAQVALNRLALRMPVDLGSRFKDLACSCGYRVSPDGPSASVTLHAIACHLLLPKTLVAPFRALPGPSHVIPLWFVVHGCLVWRSSIEPKQIDIGRSRLQDEKSGALNNATAVTGMPLLENQLPRGQPPGLQVRGCSESSRDDDTSMLLRFLLTRHAECMHESCARKHEFIEELQA